jgi:hypothetical protein
MSVVNGNERQSSWWESAIPKSDNDKLSGLQRRVRLFKVYVCFSRLE